MAGPRPPIPHWTVLVGPGPRLALLEPLLRALVTAETPAAVRRLADVEGLLERLSGHGRVVLDADRLPTEDVGILRRFLARRPRWVLVLTGDDPASPAARRFAGHPRVRWTPWPVDVAELPRLVAAPPAPDAAEEPSARPAEPTSEPDSALAGDGPQPPEAGSLAPEPEPFTEEELAEIEAILDARVDPDAGPVDEPATADEATGPGALELGPLELDPAEYEAFLAPDTDLDLGASPFAADEGASPEPAGPAGSTDPPGAGGLPEFYRAQIADLADIAQRLELSLLTFGGGSDGGRIASLQGDVSRLVQFTRTLGYLVAPPARGTQHIALRTLVEELLAGFAASAPDAPRFLFHAGPEDAYVRSDKALLVQALDAPLAVARACAPAGGCIRVSTSVAGEAEGGRIAEVVIDAPAGVLAAHSAADILTPYAIRRELPEIGPNALAAAASILRGQGGDLAVALDGGGRLRFTASLPAASGA